MNNVAASGRAARSRMRAAAALHANSAALASFAMHNVYEVECRDKDGNLKWTETVKNLVTNAGLDDMLDKYLKGSAYTAAWYVGLKGTGTIAAGDTSASHAGWSEITAYSESVRQALTLGTVSGQSVTNSASKAVFTINGAATVAGAFVIANSTKGGTTGILWGVANFTASRSVDTGDTLSVTVTSTAASS